MLKAVIVVLLVATLISLFSGLFFLVHDAGRTSRVVMALFVRVLLSALIVALIGWGLLFGPVAAGALAASPLKHVDEDE
ncbi:twin transmembrane helix small protein [Pseudomonas nitrititolerans]|nr:twin transmembrane helix small protein [Stutzerimonas nitrititolerans]